MPTPSSGSVPPMRAFPTIEVFADVVCPFTHVGLRRFVAARRERGRPDVVLNARSWPLEVVNGRPMDPDFVAEEVGEIRVLVAPDLFGGFDPAAFPATSMPALTLAAAANAAGATTGEAVALELRDLLFEQGQDVSNPGVLAGVAHRHGLPAPTAPPGASAVLADYEEGRARGVVGSPHFFIGGESFFCPSLDIRRVDDRLHVDFDRTGMAKFLDACFA